MTTANKAEYAKKVTINIQTVANASIPAMWEDPVTGKKVFNEAYVEDVEREAYKQGLSQSGDDVPTLIRKNEQKI